MEVDDPCLREGRCPRGKWMDCPREMGYRSWSPYVYPTVADEGYIVGRQQDGPYSDSWRCRYGCLERRNSCRNQARDQGETLDHGDSPNWYWYSVACCEWPIMGKSLGLLVDRR